MTVAELIEELKTIHLMQKLPQQLVGKYEEPWLEYNDNYNILDLGTT